MSMAASECLALPPAAGLRLRTHRLPRLPSEPPQLDRAAARDLLEARAAQAGARRGDEARVGRPGEEPAVQRHEADAESREESLLLRTDDPAVERPQPACDPIATRPRDRRIAERPLARRLL